MPVAARSNAVAHLNRTQLYLTHLINLFHKQLSRESFGEIIYIYFNNGCQDPVEPLARDGVTSTP